MDDIPSALPGDERVYHERKSSALAVADESGMADAVVADVVVFATGADPNGRGDRPFFALCP